MPRDRVLNILSARELSDRVGLVRATKKRDIAGGGMNVLAQRTALKGKDDRGD